MPATPLTDGGPVRALADGNAIPLLGLGVWQVASGAECVNTVRWALEVGYRHVDTAQAYENEESVGEALRLGGVPREELFLTTKFFPERSDPAAELERSLERLGVEYVDLYLIHWPAGGATWAWPGMERAHERGHARSIGVSNFNVEQLREVMAGATTAPVANQIELSPFNYRRGLVEEAARGGLVSEAYSPLGTGRHLSHAAVRDIADGSGRTPAQVLIRWGIQRGFVVLAKSTHRDRLEENASVFDFELSDTDMASLDALDRTGGTGEAVDSKWW